MKVSPLTGEAVPDECARVPVFHYVNARLAAWPDAEFVVGNPPYVGTRRMRLVLGDGYVDALRKAYPQVPENADYVMYWWYAAAELARVGKLRRFGLITTNSIGQIMNRPVLERELTADPPISIRFAVPDHPWVDSADGAAVRVAMTVAEKGRLPGSRHLVVSETQMPDGEVDARVGPATTGGIGPDLRIGASPSSAVPLRANEKIAYWGVKFYGDGFILDPEEARTLLGEGPRPLYRPFVSGRDLTGSRRDAVVIDCDGLTENELAQRWPRTYQWLLTRVKPVREQNPRAFKRQRWWIFGENQPGMRAAVAGLARYIATTETAKHRVFHLLPTEVLAEGTVAVIALDDTVNFGVLSSRMHAVWALAAGGHLGVGNDPRYNKTRCFDAFPFPERAVASIRTLGQQVDVHRKRQQEIHADLTITGMYNVLEKLRRAEPLTSKEKKIHDDGLISVLKQIHDDLDAAVFDAYGWPHDLTDDQILERLVALNAERAEEERRGTVRWLRPEFQNPAGTGSPAQTAMKIEIVESAKSLPAEPLLWPKELPRQIAAVRDLIASDGGPQKIWSVEMAASTFRKARKREVESVLDSLTALGILIAFDTPHGKRWRAA